MFTKYVVVSVLVLGFTACTHKDHDSTTGDETTMAMTDGGSYHVSWERASGDIVVGEDFDIMVYVYGMDDLDMAKPLTTDLDVAVDALMQAHGHGMPDGTVPDVEVMGDGFMVSGMQFQMEGEWSLYVDVTDIKATERASFTVNCCDG